MHHRISSVAFPHSNCRAEVGVKMCKRLIMGNTGPNGELDVPKFQRAILQYRNSPDQDTKMSPAMIVFGRCVRDLIPVLPGRYKPQEAWVDNAGLRETALRKRHLRAAERLSQYTKTLPPLRVGDHVRLQNQLGNEPLKWDKTGVVVEVKQNDQYIVRVDGSGRVTMRNRRFLRKFYLFEPSKHTPVPPMPYTTKNVIQRETTATHPPNQKQPLATHPPNQEQPSVTHHPNQEQPSATTPPIPPEHKDSLNTQSSPVIMDHPADDGTPRKDQPPNDQDHRDESICVQPTINQRPKRNIKPPKRYDPSEWELQPTRRK